MSEPSRLYPDTTGADYLNAVAGIGPLAAQWADKPHRLIYDLCAEVERLQAENADLREHLESIVRGLGAS